MGELEHEAFKFTFNGFLKVAFQGSRVTSDAGLILVRELDERLGLENLITEHLSDSRQGLNTQFSLADLLRQSVYSRLAGYEDLNDAVRVSADPTFRLIGSPHVRGLPRIPGSGRDFVDLHRLETGPKGCSVGPVSIPQQESWRRVPREGVADLRDGPRGRRMFGDIDMHDSAAVGAQDEDDEQPPEGGRRHRKEINGHQIGNVILEKARPRLRGGRSASHQILGHAGLGNRDAPLYHLAMHAGRAPEREWPY